MGTFLTYIFTMGPSSTFPRCTSPPSSVITWFMLKIQWHFITLFPSTHCNSNDGSRDAAHLHSAWEWPTSKSIVDCTGWRKVATVYGEEQLPTWAAKLTHMSLPGCSFVVPCYNQPELLRLSFSESLFCHHLSEKLASELKCGRISLSEITYYCP